MKRKVKRRTFAMIRREQDRHIANYIDNHADRLAAGDQRESSIVVRSLAGMVRAGFAEGKGAGELVTLAECPPGLFRFGETLGFKSEYRAMQLVGPSNIPGPDLRWTVGRWPEAYCVSSGEYFWGGTKTQEARAALLVEPVAL